MFGSVFALHYLCRNFVQGTHNHIITIDMMTHGNMTSGKTSAPAPYGGSREVVAFSDMAIFTPPENS